MVRKYTFQASARRRGHQCGVSYAGKGTKAKVVASLRASCEVVLG